MRAPSGRLQSGRLFVMAAKKKAKKKKKKTAPKKARITKRVKGTRKKSASKKVLKRAKPAKRSAKPAAIRGISKKRISPARRSSDLSFSGARRVPAAETDVDSQGTSRLEEADSESVSELLDEGNAFEAGVVSGVQRADDEDGKEVRTREFPEDDVPEEYLDQD